ncbi:Pleckstrin y domain-containing A member 7 [Mortierella alpina]|nr:Pleckstrin y domain-containing A member 7 [Mortierella alpina]
MVWKRRWCVLRDDCLFYYRSDTDTKPLGVLPLADYPVLNSGPDVSRKSKLAFRLSTSEAIPREHQHHIFRAETPQALDLWLEALQGHISHAKGNLDGLGPLDLAPNDNGAGLQWYANSPGRFGFNKDNSGEESGEQSIIDKVLDRLHLEDPTLSDMNDPSTLIMPAQEIPSFPQNQTPTSHSSFRTLQICPEDENLDGWLPSPAASSNLYGGTGTPIIGIRGARPGSFAQGHTSSASSSLTAPSASYSSYPDVELAGSMSGTNRNRVSGQALDAQGRTILQQGSRGSHGFHSASSSLSGYQQLQSQSPKHSPQRPNGLQLSFDKSAASPSTTPINSPLSSPKLSTFSSNSLSSAYTNPHSPRTYFYRADSSVRRVESNASLTSISTINSSPGDGTNNGKDDENALSRSAISLGQEANGGNNNSGGFTRTNPTKKADATAGKYNVGNDHQSPQILRKDDGQQAAVSGKKSKKLWSVCESSGSSQSPEKSSSLQSGGTGGKKTVSQSLDSNNSMLKGLVLICPSKKQNRDSHVSSKGLSKSMSSLFKGIDQHGPEDHQQATPLLTPPGSFHLESGPFSSSLSSSFTSSSSTRIHTPSVFHMEDHFTPSLHRPSVGDILSSRLPVLSKSPTSPPSHPDGQLHHRPIKNDNVLKKQSRSTIPKTTTDLMSSLDNEWRCVDPNPRQSPPYPPARHAYNDEGNPFRANVSRHIVAPDELALAIEKEDAEEKEQKEREMLTRVSQDLGTNLDAVEADVDVEVVVLVGGTVEAPSKDTLQEIDGSLSLETSNQLVVDLSSPPSSPLPSVPPALPKRSPRRSAPIVLPPQFMCLSP